MKTSKEYNQNRQSWGEMVVKLFLIEKVLWGFGILTIIHILFALCTEISYIFLAGFPLYSMIFCRKKMTDWNVVLEKIEEERIQIVLAALKNNMSELKSLAEHFGILEETREKLEEVQSRLMDCSSKVTSLEIEELELLVTDTEKMIHLKNLGIDSYPEDFSEIKEVYDSIREKCFNDRTSFSVDFIKKANYSFDFLSKA